MKKFEDVVINSINYEPVVGGRLGDWLQQLMQNQNELIDFFNHLDSLTGQPLFADWQRKHGGK